MVNMLSESKVEELLLKLPITADWLVYKGEIYFGIINFEATQKANKPMIDLSHCATRAFCGSVLKTVQFDKSKFKKSHLSMNDSKLPA